MKDLLFGWIFKNKFELSVIDEIIATIELIIAFFIILFIIGLIIFIIDKIKGE